MPRDSWLLRRGNFQSESQHFARFARSIADQVSCVVECDGVDDLFLRLEAAGELARIDPTVVPGAYHCAVLSDPEIEALRRIGDVVRLGRVRAIEPGRLELDRGTIPARADSCYIDCSAAGIPTLPSTPIFAGRRITPQWMRTCQPTFSAAFIGHVEATFPDDDERKNSVCRPIVPPTVPIDWLRMLRVQLDNRRAIGADPELQAWQTTTRLDPFWSTARLRLAEDAEAAAHMQRYAAHAGPARARLDELLAGSGG